MSNQKHFGVWMDNHHATVVGTGNTEAAPFEVLAHVKGASASPNSSEKNSNNQERTEQGKFFKEIASYMTNGTHVHVTGTGQVQEQFIHYLAATPQFKDMVAVESTSNKMSDESLVAFITSKS